jgi:hypothetical protein
VFLVVNHSPLDAFYEYWSIPWQARVGNPDSGFQVVIGERHAGEDRSCWLVSTDQVEAGTEAYVGVTIDWVPFLFQDCFPGVNDTVRVRSIGAMQPGSDRVCDDTEDRPSAIGVLENPSDG